MILTGLTCFVMLPWWSLCLGCSEEKNCPTDPSINGQSDRPLVLQCWRTIIDREQLFPQALLWHHQWNAVEWRDKNNEAGMSRANISLRTHFYPSLYFYNTSNVLWMSIIRTEFVWPFRISHLPWVWIKLLEFHFIFFIFFCNEMQQMCNQHSM